MAITFIENADLKVGVAVHYGARVVNLIDKATGRDWMTAGGESKQTGEGAVYQGAEAVAWDECFPTVSSWDATGTPWQRRLRDHGDLWGRPWSIDSASAELLSTTYRDRQFRFTRELRLDGPELICRYAVENLGREPLPYLWALHALLAVEPPDRIEIPGLAEVSVSIIANDGLTHSGGTLAWSGPNGRLDFSLDRVQAPSVNFLGKFTARHLPGGSARVGRPGQWLDFSWDTSIENVGIWYTYGRWFGHQEIALEPTSAPADDLGQAIEAGALPLAPGETREWRVTLAVKR